jgi:alkanesulfonate monooxygenase
MTIRIYWQLDPAAESHRLEPSMQRPNAIATPLRRAAVHNRFDYYAQVAEGAAQTAFDGLFVAHRADADESRIIAASLTREVRGLEFVAEFPASVGSAVYAAKQATTFQRSTHDRFAWAVAPDADMRTRARVGDIVAQDDLGERLDEFLTVARGVHTQRPFTFKGRHFEVENGGFNAPLNQVPFPTVFLQGESEDALDLSARHGDVHLFQPGPLEHIASLVEGLDALARQADRSVAFGLLQPILTRETDEEAASNADREPVLPGTLVGSFDTVAARLAELAAIGVSHFVLSAEPALEEAYRVGQHVLPRLRARLASSTTAAARAA